jgi:predicted ATPase
VIAAAPELSSLLLDCPNLDLLVTSRERLRIDGEHVYPVPVLDRAEARELFAARARAVRPDFAPDEAVDLLCDRLDDLPLALELAAARTVMLSSRQLLERLGSRLDVLRGGRDAESRQQTLRATIEWSHDLLQPDEQRLFARLAVFPGGCTLAAAEEICDADLDDLQSLVEKSLVRVRDAGRFWMLGTIRELALEHLAASGEEEALRRGHLNWFLELARRSGLSEDSEFLEQRHELVRPEGANIRAALDWAERNGDVETALTLAVELEGYWETTSPFEGARIFGSLLEHPDVSTALRARAFRALGGASQITGEFDAAADAYTRSLACFRELGDEAGTARLLHRQASIACRLGDPDGARAILLEVAENVARVQAPRLEAQLPGTLARVELLSGNNAAALELLLESARRAETIGFVWWGAVMTGTAAETAESLGRTAEALQLAQRALVLCHEVGDRQNTVWGLATLATLAYASGKADRAAVLWGAVEAEERRAPLGVWERQRESFAARLSALPNDGVLRGRALTLDEAVGYGLSVDSG